MSLINGRLIRSITVLSMLFFAGGAFASGWQLDMDEDGIQLYSKTSKDSPLKTVKVITTVKASLNSLVSFLSDYSQFPAWMDKVSKVQKLKDISPTERLTYTVIDSPWPERDRDAVFYSKWHQDPNTLVVTKDISSEPHYLDKDSSMIRIPLFKGEWKLVPKPDGRVQVSYRVDFNPGGKVQGWLLDMFTYQMPFKTMQNLRTAALDRYDGAKFAFIKEPLKDGVAMTATQ